MELREDELSMVSARSGMVVDRVHVTVGDSIDQNNPEHRALVIAEINRAMDQIMRGDCEIVDIDGDLEFRTVEEFCK